MSEFFDLEEFGLESEEVSSWGGEPGGLPDVGKYMLRVESCEPAVSSKGNRQLKEKLCIVASADGSPTPEEGKTFYNWVTFTQKSKNRVKCHLKALQLPLSGFDAQDAIGRTFVGEIKHEKSPKLKEDGSPWINAKLYNEEVA